MEFGPGLAPFIIFMSKHEIQGGVPPMKLTKPFLLLPIFALLLLILATGSVMASNSDCLSDSPEKVKAIITEQFIKAQPGLDREKENYGLSSDESFRDATLTDGIPYYWFNAGKPVFDGYVFPIHIGDKPVGIIPARVEKDGWSFISIKNNLSFEQDISDARKLLKETDDYKLILDGFSPIIALQIQHEFGEESIVPLRDIKATELTRLMSVPLSQVVAKYPTPISTQTTEDSKNSLQLGGGGIDGVSPAETDSSWLKYVWSIAFLVIIAIIVGLILRRKTVR
jgi:hypothetical protein